MKLTFLGWMHRKLTVDPNKNSAIAAGKLSTCFSENNYHKEPSKALECFNIKCQKTSSRSESLDGDADFYEESFDPFDFLAIGTFGRELLSTDPPTPTLATPSEKLPDPPSEITKNDLEFISYELEKFLEGEETDIPNGTSGRISQSSIITLSHQSIEGEDREGHVNNMACPLQNYLFATLVEQTEKGRIRKENASFEGVFKMNQIAARDDPMEIPEGEEKKPRKWNVAHFMKKVTKSLNSSSRSFSKSSFKASAGAPSISIKKKLSKAVKMFHPKEMTEKQFDHHKLQKGKKGISHEDGRGYNGNTKAGLNGSCKKTIGKLSSNGTKKGASTINEGHWIKTNPEFLVLEL